MSELLLELFSEEIPARMQQRAAEDLKRLVVDELKSRGLEGGAALALSTPRRLALVIEGLPAGSPATSEERKGPRVGAPEGAIRGFLKGADLASIEQATIVKDERKGDFYVARIEKPGRATGDIVSEVVPAVLAKFPWPKSMRWGSGNDTWVRPLHSILCLLDGVVVPFAFAGVSSGAMTRGHRFHGNEPFEVASFKDYGTKLKARKVLLPASERSEMIREQAEALAAQNKLELVSDDGLLAENAGLTEWPLVLMGSFDESFLDVPPECLMTSMRTHQKCFSLRQPKTHALANRFLLVSNLIPADGGGAIVAGNEKVIRARLSDAAFFWAQDKARKLEPMHFELKGITFHERLGTQWERMERITELAREIAGSVDAEPDLAGRAAQLAKADLVSGMVGEFPELQGLMGRYLAMAEGMNPKIARAIEEHYKPKGPTDTVPTEPVSIAVALADKLDTLIGFWTIGEKPTGSGDPYQLRRAALGVIRIVLENDLRLPIERVIKRHFMDRIGKIGAQLDPPASLLKGIDSHALAVDLLGFMAERLKVHLREKGVRHDLIDAVFSLGGQDDFALLVKRVAALTDFLGTDDGANLLAGVKRAANILTIEERKDKASYAGKPDAAKLTEPAEKDLYAAIQKVKLDTSKAIDVERFDGAMRALAELRAPVDAFFDKVTVNSDEPALRVNRLRLLSEIRSATLTVADLSRIAG
jgi:glycyl-tRNA synthetase beta chain